MGLLDFFVSIFKGTSDLGEMAFEPTSSIDEMEDMIKSDKEDNSNEENDCGSSRL